MARTAEGRAGVQFTRSAADVSREALAYFGAGEEKDPVERILSMISS